MPHNLINILSWNIGGISNIPPSTQTEAKIKSACQFTTCQVLCIQEVHHPSAEALELFRSHGYRLVAQHLRPFASGNGLNHDAKGGCAIFANNEVIALQLPIPEASGVEACAISLTLPGVGEEQLLNIACVYAAPTAAESASVKRGIG